VIFGVSAAAWAAVTQWQGRPVPVHSHWPWLETSTQNVHPAAVPVHVCATPPELWTHVTVLPTV
jgi:hypothetical protein